VNDEFTLEELAQAVQEWCVEHDIIPANGQAADEITERNIRYYRTLGLLDPPIGNYAKTFTEKHRLQLMAIRLYQAQGFPLRKIRDELYGQSQKDLATLAKQAARRGKHAVGGVTPFRPAFASESWSVTSLAEDFLLVSRQNQPLPRAVIEKINDLLRSVRPENETTTESKRN
jgi:DNA-binding transcriptional MerR regulator